jgi:hypothetical protein
MTLSQTADNILLAITELNDRRKPIDREFQGRPRKNKILKRVGIMNEIIEDVCQKYNLKESSLRKIAGISENESNNNICLHCRISDNSLHPVSVSNSVQRKQKKQ